MNIVITIVNENGFNHSRFQIEPAEDVRKEVYAKLLELKDQWPKEVPGELNEDTYADEDRAAYQNPDFLFVLYYQSGELYIQQHTASAVLLTCPWSEFEAAYRQ